MDNKNFAYGIPPADLQREFERRREEEMRRVQQYSSGFGGSGDRSVNPVQSYMQNGAVGKTIDGVGNMVSSGMAGTLSALGLTTPWPLRYTITPMMAATALAKAHEGIGNFRDAYRYDQGADMWGNTGLPGRPAEEENLNPLMYYLDGQ